MSTTWAWSESTRLAEQYTTSQADGLRSATRRDADLSPLTFTQGRDGSQVIRLGTIYMVLALWACGGWLIYARTYLAQCLGTHDLWLLAFRGKLLTRFGVVVVLAGPVLGICGLDGPAAVVVGLGAIAGSIVLIIRSMTPPKP